MSRAALVTLGGVACAVLLGLAWLRPPGRTLAGDEATYTAMVESLALDGDFVFDARDRDRLTAGGPPGRDTVILQRSATGIAYSKPILYPLLAAPLYPLLGGSALIALNALVMLAALVLAALYLRRIGPADHADLTVLTFAAGGSLLCLLAWRMSDALQVAMALSGLVLCLAGERGEPRERHAGNPPGLRWLIGPAAPWIGGALLGALTSLRYPNALLLLGPAAALLFRRRFRAVVAVLAGALAAFVAIGAAQYAATGAVTPYKAVRASFNPGTGYPVDRQPAETDYEFDVMTKTARIFPRPSLRPLNTAYAALYFVIGRHTGLLAYLPAALLLAAAALRRPDGIALALVGSAAALAAFYLVWLPDNYFGGAAFVGNRYFVVAYPALLVALGRLPSRKGLAAVWLVAAIAAVSAAASIRKAGGDTSWGDAGTQSHAYAGLFRWLPYESVARDIEGRRDRYWSDEFLRFVDPFARVSEWGGGLDLGAPPAEVLIATPRPHRVLRFLARTPAPVVELSIRDWSGDHRVRLEEEAPGAGARGLIEIEVGEAWRRHPFWWTEGAVWQSHVVRLAAQAPDGAPDGGPAGGRGRVDFAYLGPYRPATKFYRAALVEGELPAEVAAGERSTVRVVLRNSGQRFWADEDAVPVLVGYRFERHGRELLRSQTEPLMPLGGVVEPGGEIRLDLPVAWPRQPGVYRVRIDLTLAGVLWLEEIVGQPVLEGSVRVEPELPSVG
jgi:hypothetical protein